MRYELRIGDAADQLDGLRSAGLVDAILCDPPYGINFMARHWDRGVPGSHYWEAALRAAKPGAWLLAFGGTRAYHRLAVAIEDAGWIIRDQIAWVYGSGFPKINSMARAVDLALGRDPQVVGVVENYSGQQRAAMAGDFSGDKLLTQPATAEAADWAGYYTGLKPAWEPIIVAQAPLAGTYAQNALAYNVGALNVDACLVPKPESEKLARHNAPGANGWANDSGGPNHAALHRERSGRWPANFIHDGSPEVLDLFPESSSGAMTAEQQAGGGFAGAAVCYGSAATGGRQEYAASQGSAARFFYCAKASKAEREAGLDGWVDSTVSDGRKNPVDNPYQRGKTQRKNDHPTVKPLALTEYLARLVLPPERFRADARIAVPFCGSGSEMIGALLSGWQNIIGIDRDPHFASMAAARMEYWRRVQDARQRGGYVEGALFDSPCKRGESVV